ncbi:MAG: penicillin-binding protein 1A [Elusimicrobia bacterium]|nr:penicillin-binding protein 1A [Elusimicrobiota bacterium]
MNSLDKILVFAHKHRVRVLAAALALFMAAGLLIAGIFLRGLLQDLPSIYDLEGYTPALSTKVYDVHGDVIAEFSVEKRALLPLNKIPVDMQNAVIAMEDNKFFHHWGISPRGIARALLRDIMHQRAAQGASTITQQLAKLIFLKPEKTISRKVREIFMALQIEKNFSKQEILQMYLNQIYFGTGAHGVQAAAKIYFGKEVQDLTLGDCALLTGLIPLPERYSPFRNPDIARQRKALVLMRMLQEGYITPTEREKALAEPLPTEKSFSSVSEAPYFVEYIRQQLEPRYGFNMLWRGGMKIYTTLDLPSQKIAEAVMEKNLQQLDDEVAKEHSKRLAEASEDTEISTAPLQLQGAFMAMDVKTGAVSVMIGGRDYKETKFNRVTQAKRQPGSAFKPFVWMSALMNGYTPASQVEDIPMAFYYDGRDWRLFEGATDQYSIDLATQPFVGNKDFKIWVPQNYTGRYAGKTTMREALEKSRNLASIWLVDKVGPTVVTETARRAGIKSPLQPVLSLGLGTSAVPLLEMVNGFATFANNGIRVEPYAVTRVVDARGKVLEEHIPSEVEAFSPQYSYLMVNMMKGVVERGTGANARRLGRPIAGKTGTSQDHRDMWFIGMTPDIAAGAWMGYDDFSTIESKDWTGGGTVVPWWTQIMEELFKNQPVRDFPVPEGITLVMTDPATGLLALPNSKRKLMEAFLKGTEPKSFTSLKAKELPQD